LVVTADRVDFPLLGPGTVLGADEEEGAGGRAPSVAPAPAFPIAGAVDGIASILRTAFSQLMGVVEV